MFNYLLHLDLCIIWKGPQLILPREKHYKISCINEKNSDMVKVSFEVTGQITMSYAQVFVYVRTLVSMTKRFIGGNNADFYTSKTSL